MWIWNGKICPCPGEHIEDAAQEAILIVKHWGGKNRHPNVHFDFTFNDVTLQVYSDSTWQEIVADYHNSLLASRNGQASSTRFDSGRKDEPA
jgi:hypothetical protein